MNNEAQLTPYLGLKPAKAAEFCDSELDAGDLLEHLEKERPFNRRRLCEFLGIGESTLSGWLKEGRVPQMAKNSIVLLKAQQVLAAEVKRLWTEPCVVRSGNTYQIVEFTFDEDGERVGRVIADGIATLEDAQRLASGPRALGLVAKVLGEGLFDYVDDQCDNAAFRDSVQALRAELHNFALFHADRATWRQAEQENAAQFEALLNSLEEASPATSSP